MTAPATGTVAVEGLSFAAFVSGAEGRHPIELFAELKGLGDRRTHKENELLADAGRPPATLPLQKGEGLPLPHPLDAEWRFDETTADSLLDQAVSATHPGDAILLLGVPTVVLSALRSTVARRFLVQVEDNVVGAALHARAIHDRRFVAHASDGCAAAVLDPPWYAPVFDALVGRAAEMCRQGALILVGSPPPGMRPTGYEERQHTLSLASDAGLFSEKIVSSSLTYRTPAFELAAMHESGLRAWLPAWRRGDLLILTKRGQGRVTPLPVATPSFELTLAGVRIRLLAQPCPPSKLLSPVADGEVFPSVSARAPGRAAANLWTSGNRAFAVDPEVAINALVRMAMARKLWPKGLDSPGSDQWDRRPIDPIPQLVDQLVSVIARETAQMIELVGEAAWASSANDARFLNGSSDVFLESLRGGRV